MNPNYSTRDLIELSLLDAIGLLDDDERAAFERGFAASPPAIQAQIRREQTRLSQLDFLLPDVAPPAHLRSVVLDAVRKAMAETAVGAEEGAAFTPALVPSRRVSPLWRAGAVGFATAAVVFGVTTVQMKRDYDDLEKIIRNNMFTDQTLAGLGGAFQELIFNPNIQHVVFKPSSPSVHGMAVLLLDTESGAASLVCRNLPAEGGREYQLVVVNNDGVPGARLAGFTSTGLTTQPIKVKLTNGQRLAILPPSDPGAPIPGAVLTTDPLRI